MTANALVQLAGVHFPGTHAEVHNRNLLKLLEQAAPLVSTGTIQTVKDKVARALARSFDSSREYASEIFWALTESWPYVHWDPNRGPIPAERQRMYALYRELWDSAFYPFPSKA